MSGQKLNSKGTTTLVMGHGKSKINSQRFRPGSRAVAKAKVGKRVMCCNSGINRSSSQSKLMWWSYSPEGLRSKGTLPVKPTLIISSSIVRLIVIAYRQGKRSRSLANYSQAGQVITGVSSSSKMVVRGRVDTVRSIWVYSRWGLHRHVDGSVVAWLTPSS